MVHYFTNGEKKRKMWCGPRGRNKLEKLMSFVFVKEKMRPGDRLAYFLEFHFREEPTLGAIVEIERLFQIYRPEDVKVG